jgi:hypothetical protein
MYYRITKDINPEVAEIKLWISSKINNFNIIKTCCKCNYDTFLLYKILVVIPTNVKLKLKLFIL